MCYDGYLMNTNSIPARLLGSLHKFTYLIFMILQNRLYFFPFFFIFMKFCFEISMHLQKVSKIVLRSSMYSSPSFPSKAVSYITIV